jgi:hypothetical protein
MARNAHYLDIHSMRNNMNNNNTQNDIDVTKSFAAFADIDNQEHNEQLLGKTFDTTQCPSFGQFAPESAAFPA